MAREKTWACKQNIALVGDNDSKIAKSWMYEFYTFLSGGAGNSTAAWEILSASNASSVGGPGTITGTGSITLKEATVLLPVNILADPICVDVVPETSAFNTKSTPQAVIIISPY